MTRKNNLDLVLRPGLKGTVCHHSSIRGGAAFTGVTAWMLSQSHRWRILIVFSGKIEKIEFPLNYVQLHT